MSPESNEQPRRVSVVVPVRDERENLEPLYERLMSALRALEETYEVVFVDDGSSDGSTDVLRRLAARDPAVRVVVLRRSFGQTAALDAGFDNAHGDVLIPIDADLQNDPRDIPRLLEKLDEGYDAVGGWRRRRRDPFLTRVLPSAIANRLISMITGIKLHDFGCTIAAYRRDIISDVHLFGEMHRFLPVWVHWAGGRVTEVEVRHHPRRHGRSKYSLSRIFRVLVDLMTVHFLVAYISKPAYFFGKFGLGAFAVSATAFVWTLVDKLALGIKVHRNPILMIGIFFGIIGVQVIFAGLLAELNVRTHFAAQGHPPYFVRERINMEASPPTGSGD